MQAWFSVDLNPILDSPPPSNFYTFCCFLVLEVPLIFHFPIFLLNLNIIPDNDSMFCITVSSNHQLRARRALMQFNNVPLITRMALLLHKVYGDNVLFVLNGTSMSSANALLVLSRRNMIISMTCIYQSHSKDGSGSDQFLISLSKTLYMPNNTLLKPKRH